MFSLFGERLFDDFLSVHDIEALAHCLDGTSREVVDFAFGLVVSVDAANKKIGLFL